MPVEQQLRDLRRALQRLAAVVMWRDGVQLEPLGNMVFYECEDTTAKDTLQERISERMHEQTVDQQGDQVCRDPADLLHRQG